MFKCLIFLTCGVLCGFYLQHRFSTGLPSPSREESRLSAAKGTSLLVEHRDLSRRVRLHAGSALDLGILHLIYMFVFYASFCSVSVASQLAL